MEKTKLPYFRYAAVAGLIIGFIESTLSYVVLYSELYKKEWIMLLSFLFSLTLYAIVLWRYKQIYVTDEFRFGQGIKIGIVASFIASIIAWVVYMLFTQEMVAENINYSITLTFDEIYKKNGNAYDSESLLRGAKNIINWALSPIPYLGICIVGSIINGFFKALIPMIFLLGRKK